MVQGLSPAFSMNKYLEKLAGQPSPPSSLVSKIGLGVSSIGLGLSGANFFNNKTSKDLETKRLKLEAEQNKLDAERNKLEQKSLNALKSIHKMLIPTFEKTAETQPETENYIGDKAGLRTSGAISGLVGAKVIHDQLSKGNLTGRETLWHGTSVDRAAQIRQNGLKPNLEGVSKVVNPKLHKANADLTFLTKHKLHAGSYAAQQTHIREGGIKSPKDLLNWQQGPNVAKESFSHMLTGKGVVTVKLPTWKEEFKGVKNPEIDMITEFQKKLNPNIMYALGEKSVHVVKGPQGIPTEYIKGSKNYSGAGVSEILDFAKHNKWRFAKGVGLAGAGLGALGLGGALIDKANKLQPFKDRSK